MSSKGPIDGTAWAVWMEHMAAALGVNMPGVLPRTVHDLTSQVAARYQHPMAPVSAYLWGLTIATHPDRGPGELTRVILDAPSEG